MFKEVNRNTITLNALLIVMALLSAPIAVQAEHPASKKAGLLLDANLATLFKEYDVKATFVVMDQHGELLHIHNEPRARKRYSPASTFKIANSLIALDKGLVDGATDRFIWDGIERSVNSWNTDHDLTTAFRTSCVWCYQRVAKQLSREAYANSLEILNYGNQLVGEEVDQFWLNGTLKISAIEQLDFLRRVFIENSDTLHEEHIRIVEELMRDSANRGLYAKTGWTGPDLGVGWYVGFLRREGDVFLFALNMDLIDVKKANLRKELAIESLRLLGLIE